MDVAGVGAESSTGKTFEFQGSGFFLSHGLEDPDHPDIDRYGIKTFAGKEEDAIGDLASHPGEFAKEGAGLVGGKGVEGRQIEGAAGNGLSGGEQASGAKPEAASAQGVLGSFRKAGR